MTAPLEQGANPEEADACVVLVHGRGASAASMLSFSQSLGLSGVHYRAPQAPGFSWYPHSFLAPLSANAAGIEHGMGAIEAILDELEGRGVDPGRILLLGFSQGACLSSEYAARRPRRYGAIVILSGGLIGNVQLEDRDAPDDKEFRYEGSLDGTPILVGCSDVDPHIPVERVHRTAEVLEELDGDVDLRVYEGMGHTINDDEVTAVRDLIRRIKET